MPEEEDKYKGLLYSPEVLGGIGLLTAGLSGGSPDKALPSLLQGMQTASLFRKQEDADKKQRLIKEFSDQVPENQKNAFLIAPEKWLEKNYFSKADKASFVNFKDVNSSNPNDVRMFNITDAKDLIALKKFENEPGRNVIKVPGMDKSTDLVPKAIKTDIDKKLMTEYDFKNSFETIDVLFDPKYVTYLGKTEAFILGEAQKLGFKTTAEQNNYLAKFGEWKSEVLKNSNQYRKYITGVAAGGKEIKLLAGTIANPGDNPAVFKAKIKMARILNSQTIRRLERYKAEGIGDVTLNDKGEPIGKYKEFLEKPENQLEITEEMAVGFVQDLVNGDYNNEQIQLKIKQVFGIENVKKVNELIENYKG